MAPKEMADSNLNRKYDSTAPAWADKMRMLGYYDAYLGFLANQTFRAPLGTRVVDIGCGTGAFADAWLAIHGPEQTVTLLDPSREMLSRAEVALKRRTAKVKLVQKPLEAFEPDAPFDCALAAHVIEHHSDPISSLARMRQMVRRDGRLWLIVSKPHWCNAIIWFQWRHKAYRQTEVGRLLAETGWALEAEYAFPAGPPSRTSQGYLARAA